MTDATLSRAHAFKHKFYVLQFSSCLQLPNNSLALFFKAVENRMQQYIIDNYEKYCPKTLLYSDFNNL